MERPAGFPSPAEDYLTSTFNQDPFYSNGASARLRRETTNDTGEVVGLAVRLGERLLAGRLPLREVRRDDHGAAAGDGPAAGLVE